MAHYLDHKRELKRRRQQRLTAAKAKGRHTTLAWLEMKEFFRLTCVRCLGLYQTTHLEKDHITPIYMGGSDGLENLQPLCVKCNCSKGRETIDWRPHAAKHFGLTLPDKYKKLENGTN